MALDEQHIGAAKPQDILLLRDFHSMEATGEAETSVIITEVHEWQNEHIQYRGLLCTPAPETTLMLVQRKVNTAEDLRLYRLFEEGVDSQLRSVVELFHHADDFQGLMFSPACTIPELEAGYARVEPYPFWDMTGRILTEGRLWSVSQALGVCEYLAPNVDKEQWYRQLLVRYWFHTTNLVQLWLGWTVNANDVQVLLK